MKKSIGVFCVTLAACLCFGGCGSKAPSDFKEFKEIVEKRQETATAFTDCVSVTWAGETPNGITCTSGLAPLQISTFNEFDEYQEYLIEDYDLYSGADKHALDLIQKWGSLYKGQRCWVSDEAENYEEVSIPVMTMLENCYKNDNSNRYFFFEGFVRDEIANSKVGDVSYGTWESGSRIEIVGSGGWGSYGAKRYILFYDTENLLEFVIWYDAAANGDQISKLEFNWTKE
ncbi:MAG: hypothetical protein IJY38_04335 [Clostridia bacterium]|nr:hypothetical protein [Clostridia bacterium]